MKTFRLCVCVCDWLNLKKEISGEFKTIIFIIFLNRIKELRFRVYDINVEQNWTICQNDPKQMRECVWNHRGIKKKKNFGRVSLCMFLFVFL